MRNWLILLLISLCCQQLLAQNIFELAREGKHEELAKLVKRDPKLVSKKNEQGHTPLIVAAYNNQLSCVELLVKAGADINYKFDQGTALHGAAFKGHLHIVNFLLESGAEKNIQDSTGATPLIYATLFKHKMVAQLLFIHGADPNIKDQTGSSAMDYAKSTEQQNLVDLFKQK